MRPKTSSNICKNNFKVTTTPDTTTLEYYQSIYTHCKQRFNIPDRIEVVKKSVYQYIENCINNYFFGNYNISEVRSNLYNNLVHYSQLGTEDLNSETLATYFQELNFNIIKYCEETYPVQSQYSIDFESETETNNKGKQKLKQYSKTIPNTLILPKTTAKHLQTLEQRTTENRSEHSETAANKENNSEISEEELIDSENKENKITAYITKIPEFNGEDIETSPQEWLDQVTKAGDANGWNAARMLRTILYFLKGTAGKCLKDKLIKKICSHALEDLNSAIQHAKRYEMAIEEANCTKLVNLAIGETSLAAEKKIDQLTKKVENYFTNQQQQQPQKYQPPQRWNQNNFVSFSNNQLQNCHYCRIPGHWKRDCRKLQQNQQNRSNQHYLSPQQSYYQPPLPLAYYPLRPQYQTDYYQSALQPMQQHYLTIPEEQDFHYTAFSEGRAAARQQNPFYTPTIISPARIAENANLSDIFSFEFEANESSFLLSNAAANEQKAITAMYTEAEVEGKAIHLILDSEFTGSIITYQLMQQLKRNVDRPAQTVIITADGIKKTPVKEIDNFLFTLDRITIPVKVLVMDVPQYQVFVGNDWLQKANAKLD
ncbi:hypothetical protein G9A89_010447 [Geosiphon pyriformis]|nr:hypothetical protein G9A89_010447 [Geosiphon pyriformis]